MTDQNRTAETEQARDLVDTFQLEWDASYPGMHFKCVPSVTRLVRMGEYIARSENEKKTLEKLLKKLILSQEDAISPGGLQ